MAFDSGYLKETVGEALARGCAATVTAEPNDPVEYLGRWLHRCAAGLAGSRGSNPSRGQGRHRSLAGTT